MTNNSGAIVKLVVPTPTAAPAASSAPAATPAASAATRAATTSVDTNASVFASGGTSENKASTTVIASGDYTTKDTDALYNEIWITNGRAPNMEKLLEVSYGWSESRNMSEGEKNSAMWSIVDNNRWMINNINQTYVASQVADDVANSLGLDLSNEDAQNQLADIVGTIFDTKATDLSSYDDAVKTAIEQARNKIEFTEDGFIAKQGIENGYKTFDANVRTDQIPPEMIEATDFSTQFNAKGEEEPVKTVFCPNLNTLKNAKNQTPNDEQLSQTLQFGAKEQQLGISAETIVKDENGKIDEEATRANIEKAILANYEGMENCENLDSLQGLNVLAALGKEEGNNAIFDKQNEDTSKYMDLIYDSVVEFHSNPENAGKEFTLNCPDTEINVLSNGAMTDEELANYVLSETNAKNTITYIHAETDSIITDGNPLTGNDILNNFSYNGSTLGEQVAAELAKADQEGAEVDNDVLELGYSALEQVASNNPTMQAAIEQLKQEHPETYKTEALKMDFASLYETGEKIVLEDAQYIVSKETETPKIKDVPEEDTPEVTDPEVTDPEVTDPEVTDPEVTDPEVTDPEVTDPEVTDPEVTDPEVTDPEVTDPEVTDPEVTDPEVTDPEVTDPEETTCPDPSEIPDRDNDNLDGEGNRKDPPETDEKDPDCDDTDTADGTQDGQGDAGDFDSGDLDTDDTTTDDTTTDDTTTDDTTTDDTTTDDTTTDDTTTDDTTTDDTTTDDTTTDDTTTDDTTTDDTTTDTNPDCSNTDTADGTTENDGSADDVEVGFTQSPAGQTQSEAPAGQTQSEAPAVQAQSEAPAGQTQSEAPAVQAQSEAPAGTIESFVENIIEEQ